MINAKAILAGVKGLAILLALYAAYSTGRKLEQLENAKIKLEIVSKDEKVYNDIYSLSDAAIAKRLLRYERD